MLMNEIHPYVFLFKVMSSMYTRVCVFVYLGLHWGSMTAWAFLELLRAGLLSILVRGPLIAAASLAAKHGLSCSAAFRVSWTRDQTHVPCSGRRILYHSATREALVYTFMISFGPSFQTSNAHTRLPHQDLCSFRTQASYLLFQS